MYHRKSWTKFHIFWHKTQYTYVYFKCIFSCLLYYSAFYLYFKFLKRPCPISHSGQNDRFSWDQQFTSLQHTHWYWPSLCFLYPFVALSEIENQTRYMLYDGLSLRKASPPFMTQYSSLPIGHSSFRTASCEEVKFPPSWKHLTIILTFSFGFCFCCYTVFACIYYFSYYLI